MRVLPAFTILIQIASLFKSYSVTVRDYNKVSFHKFSNVNDLLRHSFSDTQLAVNNVRLRVDSLHAALLTYISADFCWHRLTFM